MTIGMSPKVILPAALLAVSGTIVVLLGTLAADETLTTLGVGLLAAVGVQLPAGYAANPGNVRPPEPDEPGNDERPGIKSAAAGGQPEAA